jgi:crotonobetainyl-CoA:carnitine CoA-transferase CaiB-like acyl-CoA transferase
MKVGVALVDVLTGQNAAIAILAALAERERSGRGQRTEVALLDSALAGLVNVGQAALAGSVPRRYGNAHPTIVPYQAFATADRPIVVTVGNDEQWRRFCQALEVPDLASEPRFSTNPRRVENRDALVPLLEGRLRRKPALDWLRRFEESGVPCAPVTPADEAVRDSAAVERGGIWWMESPAFGGVLTIASPLRLERTPPRLACPPPALGEHTAEVQAAGWRVADPREAPRGAPPPAATSESDRISPG